MKKLVSSYFIFLIILTLFSYLFIDKNFTDLQLLYTGFSVKNREITALIYFVFLSISFIYYVTFLILAKKKKLSLHYIKLLIGGSVAFLFFAYPAMLSYDIFNYVLTDKVLYLYHENPYVVMPIEISNEPFLIFTRAANKIALYGPTWLMLAGIPYFLFSFYTLAFLYGMKLLVIIFYLFLVVLIWKLSKNVFSVVFFALNPLVLYESVISGHNDVVMMAFCLYSFYSLQEKKVFKSFFSYIVGVCIKYSVVALFPIWIWLLVLTVKNKKIDWNKVYVFSSLVLLMVFLASPIREEMYPWYAIWFLPFIALLVYRKWIIFISVIFSFGLMLRYIPFLYTGNYMGLTPVIREILTILPFMVLPVLLIKFKNND